MHISKTCYEMNPGGTRTYKLAYYTHRIFMAWSFRMHKIRRGRWKKIVLGKPGLALLVVDGLQLFCVDVIL